MIARNVRLANDSGARRKGLLGVSEMDADSGLWISPCEAVHTFGMKMPIDVVFMDRKNRVRKISHALRPNRIAVSLVSNFVVELQSGRVAATETKVGDQLAFRQHSQDDLI
jgi:uncharacterized membrane protein (UPF0127 family)